MRATLLALLTLAACTQDETVAAYTADRYKLVELNGAPFAASATLDVSVPGRISGRAPCNSYFASQSAPYPWIEIGLIGASRAACPDLALETAFFNALRTMEFAESLGPTLILSNSTGQEMVFQALL